MEEHLRSNPDFIVYCPKGETPDTDNEHFLVLESPHEGLLAFWTQSSCENYGNNHVVMAKSLDGQTWSSPKTVIGPDSDVRDQRQASWQFPVITSSGRIYLFFLMEIEKYDLDRASSGAMACIYSDDCGNSWTEPTIIPMPRNQFDHADATVPKSWIVWQIPTRLENGDILVGYTHWTSPSLNDKPPAGWYSRDSRCRFFTIKNIDQGPAPSDILIDWHLADETGLEVAYPGRDDISVAQEPSLTVLPDGTLFCTLRTFTGFIYYALSLDNGVTWSEPEVLRDWDKGERIKQPIASCPVYSLEDGRFLLIHHNNDGHLGEFGPGDALHNRRPAFVRVGEFRPNSKQKVWFSKALQILDTDGVCIGPKQTCEIATYPSLTEYKGKRILWYPDRKFYLLGKHITDELIADLSVRSQNNSATSA